MIETESGKYIIHRDNTILEIKLPEWLEDASQEAKDEYRILVKKHISNYLDSVLENKGLSS